MGCGQGAITKISAENLGPDSQEYRINVISPSDKRNYQFKHRCDYNEMPLPTIMNLISYNENEKNNLDANFISKYNAKDDRFEYFVQKMLGFEIENSENPKSGKLWVVYINETRAD